MRSVEFHRLFAYAAGCAVVAAICAVAGRAAAQGSAAPAGGGEARLMAQGVRIPFDHDDEGRVKSEVYAERATVPDAEGETFAEKVRIVLSKDAKDTNATVIVTDACRINFSNKTVRSNSPIRLDQPGLTMTGNGFRWSGTTEQMKIVRDACVVTTRSFIEQRQGRSSAPTALPGFRKEGY